MNRQETAALVLLVISAQDRPIPLASITEAWQLTLGDLDYELAREAVVAWVKASPKMPTPADIRATVKRLAEERERRQRQMQQVAERSAVQPNAQRTGAAMARYVLQRLKDEGQDVKRGKFLGKERAAQIAEEACKEWLEQTR